LDEEAREEGSRIKSDSGVMYDNDGSPSGGLLGSFCADLARRVWRGEDAGRREVGSALVPEPLALGLG
jgi:hypothetical protein